MDDGKQQVVSDQSPAAMDSETDVKIWIIANIVIKFYQKEPMLPTTDGEIFADIDETDPFENQEVPVCNWRYSPC